ncbi:MAG: choline-sulfatase [Proteobacteria bacterium]|nr:MAG: choline-sulfatase [Pseudomonadota bacterium]
MTVDRDNPNILLIMADQMTVNAMSIYGNRVAKMPNLERLASESVVFDNAYCASPLCAPARFSLLTGKESVKIDAFDNASEFPAATPTLVHHLRSSGYWTALCGKMHFVGPDQLHGFNERLTTDVYPASYAWVPHWDKGASYITSGVTCASILEAAPCIRSMQMDYDDEVEYRGVQKLFDVVRSESQRPFFLTVSFTHPHHPFTISHDYWDRYSVDEIDAPSVEPIAFEELDYHSRGLYFAHGRHLHDVTEAHVRNARHAYYGMLSYVDDKIGHLLDVLDETGLSKDTMVIFTSDHGEMLGERGMWHKHNFFEPSVRVPLTMRLPGRIPPSRVSDPVSHIDLAPTLLDFVGNADTNSEMDGVSLRPAIEGEALEHEVVADYLAIGPCVPCRMIRKGNYKYLYTHGHDEQLFDLDDDPRETKNLADDSACQAVKQELKRALFARWNPEHVDGRVKASQRRRIAINRTPGDPPTWDFVYRKGDETRFVRGRDVDETKGKYRLPVIASIAPNRPPLTETQIDLAMKTGKLP